MGWGAGWSARTGLRKRPIACAGHETGTRKGRGGKRPGEGQHREHRVSSSFPRHVGDRPELALNPDGTARTSDAGSNGELPGLRRAGPSTPLDDSRRTIQDFPGAPPNFSLTRATGIPSGGQGRECPHRPPCAAAGSAGPPGHGRRRTACTTPAAHGSSRSSARTGARCRRATVRAADRSGSRWQRTGQGELTDVRRTRRSGADHSTATAHAPLTALWLPTWAPHPDRRDVTEKEIRPRHGGRSACPGCGRWRSRRRAGRSAAGRRRRGRPESGGRRGWRGPRR